MSSKKARKSHADRPGARRRLKKRKGGKKKSGRTWTPSYRIKDRAKRVLLAARPHLAKIKKLWRDQEELLAWRQGLVKAVEEIDAHMAEEPPDEEDWSSPRKEAPRSPSASSSCGSPPASCVRPLQIGMTVRLEGFKRDRALNGKTAELLAKCGNKWHVQVDGSYTFLVPSAHFAGCSSSETDLPQEMKPQQDWRVQRKVKWPEHLSRREQIRVNDALDAFLAASRPDEVLCRHHGLGISRRTIACLGPEGLLNDEVVNVYFRLIQDRSRGSCWCPNSFLLPVLLGQGVGAARRWARKASLDLNQVRCILIPVHVGGTHWALAIVTISEARIMLLDSLGMSFPESLWPRLRRFLILETGRLSWHLDLDGSIAAPMQPNMYDCGVFMCLMAEHYEAGKPFDFCTSDEAMSIQRERIAAALLRGRLT